jgi:Uma2 family endonuclease
MATALPARARITVDEFLRFDGDPETRYELVDGEIVAMAPPRDAHGTIAGNCWGEIDRRLEDRPPCRAVVEAGIRIDEHSYFQADVAATCAAPRGTHWVEAPFLIVEVVSESSELHDFWHKATRYIALATVQEVWLVDSRERTVQTWRRAGDEWVVSLPFGGSASFPSATLGGEVALDRLYRNTGL